MLVYIGTYTRGGSEGIYVYRLDESTGALQPTGQTAKTENPSYLAVHPSGRFLYAVNEVSQFQGQPSGAVSAFAIDARTGGLTFLNQQASGGRGPCYVSIEESGNHVLVANYSSGSVAILPLAEDGSLRAASDVVQHEGSGTDPKRQSGPHAHFIHPDPTNRFALACDLGLDKVMIYRLAATNGKLPANDMPWAEVEPGAGPRHIAFAPNGNHAYLVNEMGSSLSVFAWDAGAGRLTRLQTCSLLPAGFAGENTGADIHVAPTGKFVYGTNRGHDSVAIFAIDADSGLVTPVGHEPTQGRNPRNFAIDPSGRFLLAANQDSDSVVVFRLDRDSGRLQPTGHTASVPKPVCVKFLAAGK